MRRQVLISAGVLLLILIGLTSIPCKIPLPDKTGHTDKALWKMVIDRMRAGESYYTAMETSLRVMGDYALRPFTIFRLPALAAFIAAFRTNLIPQIVLVALSIVTLLAWMARARSIGEAGLLVATLSFSVFAASVPGAVLFHDAWVGMLIALALAVHPRLPWLSVLCGLLALSLREHAVIFAGVMWLASWRRWREFAAWTVLLAVFVAYVGIHAWLVSGHVAPDDPVKSWVAGGGWPFILATARWTWLTFTTPTAVAALVVPLALVGLASMQDSRPLAVVGAYVGAFMFVGNADNWYWGLLYAPLLAVGIAEFLGDHVWQRCSSYLWSCSLAAHLKRLSISPVIHRAHHSKC